MLRVRHGGDDVHRRAGDDVQLGRTLGCRWCCRDDALQLFPCLLGEIDAASFCRGPEQRVFRVHDVERSVAVAGEPGRERQRATGAVGEIGRRKNGSRRNHVVVRSARLLIPSSIRRCMMKWGSSNSDQVHRRGPRRDPFVADGGTNQQPGAPVSLRDQHERAPVPEDQGPVWFKHLDYPARAARRTVLPGSPASVA